MQNSLKTCALLKGRKVFLSEQVSSILKCDSSPKLKDPGVATISCFIGNHKIKRALLDLGSSVDLMPYSVYLELGLGELKPSKCTLQLADRSVRTPRGRIDDVLIQIDKDLFPVDFVVLDMDPSHAYKKIPVILECPFLATANATINCTPEVMDVSVMNMRVRLNIFKACSQLVPEDESECFFNDVIDEMIEEVLPAILNKDFLGACLSYRNLGLFDLKSTTGELDSTLDSTPHLESSLACPVMNVFPLWLVLLCHLLLCPRLNLS